VHDLFVAMSLCFGMYRVGGESSHSITSALVLGSEEGAFVSVEIYHDALASLYLSGRTTDAHEHGEVNTPMTPLEYCSPGSVQ
jgi:hypothetical protein